MASSAEMNVLKGCWIKNYQKVRIIAEINTSPTQCLPVFLVPLANLSNYMD